MKAKTKTKTKDKKQRAMIITLMVFVCLMLIATALGVWMYFSMNRPDTASENGASASGDTAATEEPQTTYTEPTSYDLSVPYKVDPVDAEGYLNEIGSVSGKTDVYSSTTVRDAHTVCRDFESRGFKEATVVASYDIDGNFIDETVSRYSYDEYPMYTFSYITEGEQTWVITEINGSVTAMPLTYNLETDMAPVILCEKPPIMSYDSATDSFMEMTPDSTMMRVKVVSAINAELLESMTMEELNR